MEKNNPNRSGANPKTFSFFLPLKIYQPELDLRRLVRLNLRSIEHFFERELLNQVVIATRTQDIEIVRQAIAEAKLSIEVKVLDEFDIIPSLKFLGGLGWFRQQVLKLFSWRVIDSPYVILLDDDVIMTRPTGLKELTLDDKLIMSHLHADGFRQYLDSSCPLIGYSRNLISPQQRVMNVTPEIMVTDELKSLIKEVVFTWQLRNDEEAAEFLMRVSRDYSDPPVNNLWINLACRVSDLLFSSKKTWMDKRRDLQNWSEYTLYWVYLLKKNRTHHYYDYNSDIHARQLNDEGVWFEEQAKTLGIDAWMDRTFAPGHEHCFAMYSARIENVDRNELYHRVEQFLRNK